MLLLLQEGARVQPLLLRSSLKKANSFGEQPASPGQLLFCRQDTPRRQAQDALLLLLACNKAAQAVSITALATSSQAQHSILYRQTEVQDRQRDLSVGRVLLQGLEQDSLLTQEGRAIVLECTEDPFPWRSALGQSSNLLKVIRYVQTRPAAFDDTLSCH